MRVCDICGKPAMNKEFVLPIFYSSFTSKAWRESNSRLMTNRYDLCNTCARQIARDIQRMIEYECVKKETEPCRG